MNLFVLVGGAIIIILVFWLVSYTSQKINPDARFKFFRYIFEIAFLPILETIRLFKMWRYTSLRSKIISPFVISFTLLLWIIGYSLIGYTARNYLGFVPEPIAVSGTGSMYPTFPKGNTKTIQEQSHEVVGTPGMFPYPNGLSLFGYTFFGHKIGRGDIVVFENDKTDEITQELYGQATGWVKRVIALPGESVEIKNGIVYINDSPLPEPYTAKAHSTFGQSFLRECNKVIVPPDSIFAMGDNRKGSGDSREVGFIKYQDIHFVLPYSRQEGELKSHYRDTTKDFDEATKIRLDEIEYLTVLNKKRAEVGAKQLLYQPKLEDSARRRGEVILKYDDFSFEATRSGYTPEKAMSDANYSNITYGEIPSLGYYDAQELIDNQFEFADTKAFLLNKDFQEFGVSEVEGNLNGCPAQVVVQHFAGYIPPNYTKEVVESWNSALKNLKDIQPSWESLKNAGQFYTENKKDIDRINEIISIRITNLEGIVSRMNTNQWLTTEQERYAESTDSGLANELINLTSRLNSSSLN